MVDNQSCQSQHVPCESQWQTAYELRTSKKMPRRSVRIECITLVETTTRQAKVEPRCQDGAVITILEHSLEYIVVGQLVAIEGTVARYRDAKRLIEGPVQEQVHS
eukprot:1686515-Amphidinium_carterae.3